MTPDRRSVVIADWSGGTVAIELSTGARRILLAGSQRWIAVSPRGEIAWSNEADDAPGNVCIASLSHLPAA
ncbi:MAG TPA: hypothetical protein VGK63_06175 [Candidatus Limnocylindrales bacterium]